MTTTAERTADVSVVVDELTARVQQEWPDLNVTDAEVTAPPQGLDHQVIFIGDSLVVRSPITSAYCEQAPIEAAVLDLLAPETVAELPSILRLSTDGTLSLVSRVKGSPLDADHWNQLSSPSKHRATEELASLLTALHGAHTSMDPVCRVTPWFIDSHPNNDPRALPEKIELSRTRVHLLPMALQNLAEEIFLGLGPLLNPAPTPHRHCLIHSDLYDSHLLWDNGLGVIDFSDMNLGDPAIDFAHLTDLDPYLADEVFERTPLHHADPSILDRAWAYKRWDVLYLLIDHLRTGRTGEWIWERVEEITNPARPGSR